MLKHILEFNDTLAASANPASLAEFTSAPIETALKQRSTRFLVHKMPDGNHPQRWIKIAMDKTFSILRLLYPVAWKNTISNKSGH